MNVVTCYFLVTFPRLGKGKAKVNAYSSYETSLTATGTHMPYGIAQCYLHPAEVTFPPLPQTIKTGTRFSDPGGMQG